MMKKYYITLISSDNYADGVIVLWESLKRTSTHYSLLVAATDNISKITRDKITAAGLEIIDIPSFELPVSINDINTNKPHWNNTFSKLSIFDLTQYEKLVYIDSDMLVLHNIDYLFNLPHLSAVNAGKSYPRNESWNALNSGLMVIVPNKNIETLFRESFESVIKMDDFSNGIGDQDIINAAYPDWSKRGLALNEKYNVFINYVDYYKKYVLNEEIVVMHFVGRKKPWQRNIMEQLRYVFYLIRKRRYWELLYYYKYLSIYYTTKLK